MVGTTGVCVVVQSGSVVPVTQLDVGGVTPGGYVRGAHDDVDVLVVGGHIDVDLDHVAESGRLPHCRKGSTA